MYIELSVLSTASALSLSDGTTIVVKTDISPVGVDLYILPDIPPANMIFPSESISANAVQFFLSKSSGVSNVLSSRYSNGNCGLPKPGTVTVLKPESNLRSPLNSILPAIVVVDDLPSKPPVIVIMLSTPPVSVHATPNSNLPCSEVEVTLGAVALILANC